MFYGKINSSEYGVFSNNQPFLQNIAQSVLQQPDVRGVIILNAASEKLVIAGEFYNKLESAVTDENLNMPKPLSRVREAQADKVKEIGQSTEPHIEQQ